MAVHVKMPEGASIGECILIFESSERIIDGDIEIPLR
jgi:hypothetical protein